MAGPIRFYFDFASPYAYFAADQIDAIGKEFGREVDWQPVLMWAVFRAQGIAAPFDSPARRKYMLHDMQRSAAFFGLPYRHPEKMPLSAHLAGRLYYAVKQDDPEVAQRMARRLLPAFFVDGRDISDLQTLAELAGEFGIDTQKAIEGMNGPAGRAGLEAAVADAVDAGVIGSPYFLIDGQGMFGADRLPQLRWMLSKERT
jgi:2-hydroxychromene-2-carboxylate isomerase